MNLRTLRGIVRLLFNMIISVPVRLKIAGIILLTVLTVGLTLNYWVTASLSDWLSYLLTDVRVEAAMRAGNRSVLLITFLAAAGSLVIASFLTFLLTRPLVDLRDMAVEVSQGNLEARATVWANDEIGEVAQAINTMTDHLLQTQRSLARTNRRLTATNRIMLAAERENEIHDVLYAILTSIADVMKLETGWVYLRDPERNVYHLASWYGIQPSLEKVLLHEGKSAVCQCQQELLTNDSPSEARITRCGRLTIDSGYPRQLHITIPIEVRNQKYGVLNFLCPSARQISTNDLEMLSTIGVQISEIVANAWLRMKLAEKEQARQMLLESLVEAQEEERGRLARELHDGAGQMLTTLLVRIKTLEKSCPNQEMKDGLHSLLGTVAETIDQVRDLSYHLRPAALEEFDFSVALTILLEEMTADTPIIAHCHTDLADIALPPGVEATLYRIAQEALTNVVRHANANNVRVTLSKHDGTVTLYIQDDGCGFDPHRVTIVSDSQHLGLISMRERAAIAGGSLTIDAAPGDGASILVRVPLPEKLPI